MNRTCLIISSKEGLPCTSLPGLDRKPVPSRKNCVWPVGLDVMPCSNEAHPLLLLWVSPTPAPSRADTGWVLDEGEVPQEHMALHCQEVSPGQRRQG